MTDRDTPVTALREAAEAISTFCNCGPDIVQDHEDICIQSEPKMKALIAALASSDDVAEPACTYCAHTLAVHDSTDCGAQDCQCENVANLSSDDVARPGDAFIARLPEPLAEEMTATRDHLLASSDDVAGSGERLADDRAIALDNAFAAWADRYDVEVPDEAWDELADAIVAAPTTEAPPKDALEDERRIEMAKALAPILRQAEDDIATVHPRGTPLSHAPLFLADRLAAAGVWAITTLREDAPTTEAPPKDWYDRDAEAFGRAHRATEAPPKDAPE